MENDLKVLMISSDRNILVPGSVVSERMKEYGALVEELHIVLLSDAQHGLKDKQLSKNVWVYPTNSISRFLRPRDAVKLGKKLGLKQLDLWGALGQDANPKDPWQGFHQFKKKMGAEGVEYIGTYDLIFNQPLYYLFTFVDKLMPLKLFLLKLTGKG